jgi:single-stranded-DNA-specific exonuclease
MSVTRVLRRRDSAPPTADYLPQLHPVLRRVFAARQVHSVDELQLTAGRLLPYHDLKNIDSAVEILVQALQQQQHVLVCADFDADGATSCAIAVRALRAMGAAHVSFLVPNRFEYGYGLTPEIVALAAQQKPDVLVTVDNGISSIEGVRAAKSCGMRVVITDHHLPGEGLPEADAIVNPNQVGDPFSSKNLAGCGVIFYVMMALRARLRELDWFTQQGIAEPNLAQWLDLVALGTVADVVPLDANNRILVKQGLQRIRAGHACPGILALLQVAMRAAPSLSATDLAFAVAPRLNAAGRMRDMSLGIGCLLAESMTEAMPMAVQLDALNRERREVEDAMQLQAAELMHSLASLQDDAALPAGICLYDADWHQGVIGILAGRIKDQYHRPAIAFAPAGNGQLKGSARSIPGVHIRDVLDSIAARAPHVLQKFGGHAMAAGLTLQEEQFPAFAQAFAAEVKRVAGDAVGMQTLWTDGELMPTMFNLSLATAIRDAGPWGQHFPEPLFEGIFNVIIDPARKINELKGAI